MPGYISGVGGGRLVSPTLSSSKVMVSNENCTIQLCEAQLFRNSAQTDEHIFRQGKVYLIYYWV